jgi:hypothetical protein
MPYRFYLHMGKWGTGIEKHSLWYLLVMILIVLAILLAVLVVA